MYCKIRSRNVWFPIKLFLRFQNMCTQIAAALDKLGNSQPPKFANLSPPGSAPAGVSCFSEKLQCKYHHNGLLH